MTLDELLARVARGELAPEEAASTLRSSAEIRDLGFARLDQDRVARTGWPEVVFGPGKSAPRLALLLCELHEAHGFGMATRVEREVAEAVLADLPEERGATWDSESRILCLGQLPSQGRGQIAVAAAGTSDRAVAEEAAQTAERLGNEVDRVYDVGVAGLHRLIAVRDRLEAAEVIIAVAGMEGALFSVIKGLVSRPVIAVPTSVGGGLGGHVALFSALSACASGLTVVGVDGGFSAGFAAAVINRERT
ncbi:MAG: nickel pincer cofactor biosynthesis protein LarB [Myxococcota bacterium]